MKLVEYKCPSCGATLSFSKEDNVHFCSHCGAHIVEQRDCDEKKYEYLLKKQKERHDHWLQIFEMTLVTILVMAMIIFALMTK